MQRKKKCRGSVHLRKKEGRKTVRKGGGDKLPAISQRHQKKLWQVVIAIIITSTILVVAAITCFLSPAPLTAATFRNITRAV